jgi:hypothetical protein
MPATKPDPMTLLQNQWYRAVLTGLSADPASAQLRQPMTLIPGMDTALWACQDVVPPLSLTHNTVTTPSGRFFDEYARVIEALRFPPSTFAHDVGVEVDRRWTAFLHRLRPTPTENQLPDIFFDWAMLNAPEAARIGSADLQLIAQQDATKAALAPYRGPSAKPVDFRGGAADLAKALAQARAATITLESDTGPADVSGSWTHGVNDGVDGLWTGSGTGSELSIRFAASTVRVTTTVRACVTWTSTPTDWYDSAWLNTVYADPTSPLWPVESGPRWPEMFGPHGRLRQAISSLLVVDGIIAVVTADPGFDVAAQRAIAAHAAAGLWPCYLPDSAHAANTVSFDAKGALRIETTSQPYTPLVLGANVLDIGRYLGHSATAIR